MEKLIEDIERYAQEIERTPEWVLRAAIGASWRQWEAWKTGKSTPTMRNADRIQSYIAENPPSQTSPSPQQAGAAQ